MNRKKILFFLFGDCGGAERMTLNIAKSLPLEVYEVKVVVCGRANKIYPFIPDVFNIIRIPWLNIYCFPRIRIGMVLLKEKPDCVFCSTMILNVLVLQMTSLFNIKSIVRNDNMLKYVNSDMHKKISKWYKKASTVIAQQEEMQSELIHLIGTDEDHVVCLHNPVDEEIINQKCLEPSPYPADDSINYLWVGNYLPSKGHDILAEAFILVHSNNPKTHLYFVGNIIESFPNYIKTKKIVEDAGLHDFVHFIGQQENPYKWMKHCDCFVLPSRIEGLPNVLLEAMYLRRPVVASVCIPVIDRIVNNGYNGYKVEPEQPVEMAMAMEKALQLRDFRPTFKTAKKRDFENLFKRLWH